MMPEITRRSSTRRAPPLFIGNSGSMAAHCSSDNQSRCPMQTDLFRSGRHLAAWLGLTPRESSSGGKQRLGRVSKQGDPYLRRLLVVGATAVLRFTADSRRPASALSAWAGQLKARKPYKVVALSLANKLARIAWATWHVVRSTSRSRYADDGRPALDRIGEVPMA